MGLFLLTRKNEYQRLQETDAVATARRLKVPLEVHFAENEVDTQLQQIETFIRARSSDSMVVVEAVDDESLAGLANAAVSIGIGWFLLHRVAQYLRPLRSAFPTAPVSTVTADHLEIGRIQGKQFVALLRGRGNLLYVQGPSSASAAMDRLRGVTEVLTGTTIRYHVLLADWTEAGAEKAVSSWLASPENTGDVQLVGCQNDTMAMGAIRALARSAAVLRRPEWTSIPVTGVDGILDYGLLMVDQQRLAATVIMPPAAGRALELIHEIWTTPSYSPPVIERLPVRSYPELAAVVLGAPPAKSSSPP